jgi:hypothetical protein
MPVRQLNRSHTGHFSPVGPTPSSSSSSEWQLPFQILSTPLTLALRAYLYGVKRLGNNCLDFSVRNTALAMSRFRQCVMTQSLK